MRRPRRKPIIRLPNVFPICGALVLDLAPAPAPAPADATEATAEQLPPAQAALCIHLQHQLHSLDEGLDAYGARVATARLLIEEQGLILQSMKQGLDQSDPPGVKVYNEKVDPYGLTLAHYNRELLPELERRRDAFNAKARAYNKDCAGKEVR